MTLLLLCDDSREIRVKVLMVEVVLVVLQEPQRQFEKYLHKSLKREGW